MLLCCQEQQTIALYISRLSQYHPIEDHKCIFVITQKISTAKAHSRCSAAGHCIPWGKNKNNLSPSKDPTPFIRVNHTLHHWSLHTWLVKEHFVTC